LVVKDFIAFLLVKSGQENCRNYPGEIARPIYHLLRQANGMLQKAADFAEMPRFTVEAQGTDAK